MFFQKKEVCYKILKTIKLYNDNNTPITIYRLSREINIYPRPTYNAIKKLKKAYLIKIRKFGREKRLKLTKKGLEAYNLLTEIKNLLET
jgi:Mn-dependent DtxR family transcriptional regulator